MAGVESPPVLLDTDALPAEVAVDDAHVTTDGGGSSSSGVAPTKVDETGAAPGGQTGLLGRVTGAIDNALRSFFFRLGYLIAGRPVLFLIGALLLTGGLTAGVVRLRTESRGNKLWVPQGTRALRDEAVVEAEFGQFVRSVRLIATADDGGDVATRAGLSGLIALERASEEVRTTLNGEELTYDVLCFRRPDAANNTLCSTTSVLGAFYDPESANLRDDGSVDFLATVEAALAGLNDAEIKTRLAGDGELLPTSSGGTVQRSVVLGGTAGSGADFSARALYLSLSLRNEQVEQDGEDVDERADAWEEAWSRRLLYDNSLPVQGAAALDFRGDSSWAQEEAFSGAVSGDVTLFTAGFVLLFAYVMLFLGEFHAVRSRLFAGAATLLNVGLAIGSSFGLASLIGSFYGPVHQILPLLLLGVGADDGFVVVQALDDVRANPRYASKTAQERVALALSNSGVAIFLTSATNVAVFLISSTTKLPALRHFSWWAALGVFFDFVYTLIFLVPCLLWDERRMAAGRRDCVPCVRAKPAKAEKETNLCGVRLGFLSRFLSGPFARILLNRFVRLGVLAAFVSFFGAMVYGASQLELRSQFSDFFPDDSPSKAFNERRDEFFSTGDSFAVYTPDLNYPDPAVQAELLRLCAPETGAIAQSPYVEGPSVDCWYARLRETVTDAGLLAGDAFYPALDAFLGSPAGTRFQSDVRFATDGTISLARVTAQQRDFDTNEEEVDSMEALRQLVDDSSLDGAFAYTFAFTFVEQQAVLIQEAALTVGLSLVFVLVVTLILIGHPFASAITLASVGGAVTCVLGIVYFTDTQINSVSVISLALAVGLSVDYTAHIVRSFMEQVGTRRDRAAAALGALGPPVFHASTSTFLAILLLAFSQSFVFRVLFKVLVSITTIGVGFGFLFTPVALSLVGPPSLFNSVEDREEGEERRANRLTARVHGGSGVDAPETRDSGVDDDAGTVA
ncbi:hypothetical protein BU14_0025s0048 [Porphyra umbilicalis]|uniref:SSD domain-containing protein n=1 Tax=Porphyra umbilicalis TaxID=2786 RepID=A0A1X6PJZ3_PORUM|nr:hypothetical protein BU14_0025s0048 [Porphyra umbilicalis]|eukprot:OSX81167.1 hypothetical protein BU14_0025s0048 [Porphyra umbilicalis]